MTRNSLYNADCMSILTMFHDNSVDALITDPPYGTASDTKLAFAGGKMKEFNHHWDREAPLEYIRECARILKDGASGFIFVDKLRMDPIIKELDKNNLKILNTFYWVKTNPPPHARKNFSSAIETAIFFRKPGKILTWTGKGIAVNVYQCPLVMGKDREDHPTQKPENLMRHLISLVTQKDDVVLDPFMGSGSTGAAALKMDRKFIGIEKDPAYFAMAQNRLKWIEENEQIILWNQRIEEGQAT